MDILGLLIITRLCNNAAGVYPLTGARPAARLFTHFMPPGFGATDGVEQTRNLDIYQCTKGWQLFVSRALYHLAGGATG